MNSFGKLGIIKRHVNVKGSVNIKIIYVGQESTLKGVLMKLSLTANVEEIVVFAIHLGLTKVHCFHFMALGIYVGFGTRGIINMLIRKFNKVIGGFRKGRVGSNCAGGTKSGVGANA